MKNKKFAEVLVKAFFKPQVSSIDLLMLVLVLVIFKDVLVQSVLFFTWYFVNKSQIVPNLGFEVIKRW
jgi:hypothetical protein